MEHTHNRTKKYKVFLIQSSSDKAADHDASCINDEALTAPTKTVQERILKVTADESKCNAKQFSSLSS